MTWLRIARGSATDRPLGRRAGDSVRSGLWVIALLAATGSLVAAGDSLAGMPGFSSARSPASAADDVEHGKRVAEMQCAACHGADGNGTDARYPKLAGQDPAYLYRQLRAFRTGARASDVMSGIARALAEADAVDVARFYAGQAIRPDSIHEPGLAATGERLFLAGGGPGRAPACAMCHGSPGQRGMMMGPGGMMGGGMMGPGMMGPGMMGPGMMGRGMMADIPRLNGQHAAYLVDQLNRFAAGLRPSMMMSRIAAALSETDRKAVAEYLSGQR